MATTMTNHIAGSSRWGYAAFASLALDDSWSDRASDESRFLALCAGMSHLAHGQLLQDLWVVHELKMKPGGYFVEFGAHDGDFHSNTYLLE